MALQFKAKVGGMELPEAFKEKRFRSFVDMANFADKHGLPDGKYWILNDKGQNALTMIRELTRKNGNFYVEGRGNV